MRVLGAPSIAETQLEQFLTPTLRKVGPHNIQSFNKYLASRHILDRVESGKLTPEQLPKGFDLSAARTYVDTLSPSLEPLADEVAAYSRRILKYARDGGLVSDELYNKLIKEYPRYVPLERIIDDVEKRVGGFTKAPASLEKQTAVRKLKGSERDIRNPLEALAEKTLRVTAEVERNRTAAAIAALRHFEQFEDVIKRVKPPAVPVANVEYRAAIDKDYLQQVKTFAEKLGAKIKTTGQPGRTLGLYRGGGQVERKFTTPEEIVSHEVGHFLDDKFGLKQKFYRRGNTKAVGDELYNFVLDQGQPQSRANNPSERFAHAFEWWLSNRALAKKDIPLFSRTIEDIILGSPSLETIYATKGGKPISQTARKLLNKTETKAADLSQQLDSMDEVIAQHPAAGLEPYVSKRGEFAGGLKEVTGKKGETQFARFGDDIANELGFADSEAARVAFDEYRALKTQRKDIMDQFKEVAAELKKTTKQFKQLEPEEGIKELRPLLNIRPTPGISLEKMRETIFRPSVFGPTEPHITVLENGEKVFYQVPKEFEQVANGLNKETLNMILQGSNQLVRLSRLGFTGSNIPFALTNFFRDQQTALFVAGAKGTVLNPFDFGRALFSTLKRDQLYQNFLASGAGYSNFFSIGRRGGVSSVEKLAEKTPGRIKHVIKNPKEWLKAMEDIVGVSEQVTRVQQYQRVGRGIGQVDPFGAPTRQSLEAMQAARETTVDFGKRGAYGNALNAVWIYLNAGIQGVRLAANTVKKPDALLRIAGGLYGPVVATTLWNTATPERREAYMKIPDFEKNSHLIVLPPTPKEDEDGYLQNAIKVPLPHTFLALAIPVRASVEYIANSEPDSISELMYQTLEGISPVQFNASAITPTAILPIVEVASNTRLFTGTPIVPRREEGLPPGEQRAFDTSGTVAKIGEALNLSPPKLQHFVRSYGGGVGLQVLNAIDRGMAAVGLIDKEAIGGRGLIEDIKQRTLRTRTGRQEEKEYKETRQYQEQAQSRSKKEKQAAEKIYQELQAIPAAQWQPMISDLKQVGVLDEAVFKKLKTLHKETALDLTKNEKRIKLLPIKERALWINDKYQALPPQEKKQFLSDLKTKGILNEDVFNELKQLRQ